MPNTEMAQKGNRRRRFLASEEYTMTDKPNRLTVTLVRSAYQPSKGEMENVIYVRKANGSMPTP